MFDEELKLSLGQILSKMLEEKENVIREAFEHCGYSFDFIMNNQNDFETMYDPMEMKDLFYYKKELLFSIKPRNDPFGYDVVYSKE